MVDDDPGVHRLVSALFTSEGHVVEAVRSGEQALRMLRERRFDLMIADAMARGADGAVRARGGGEAPETCRRLILVYAGSEGPDRPRPRGSAPRKPFNLRDLRAPARDPR